jgi:hypothetical protein
MSAIVRYVGQRRDGVASSGAVGEPPAVVAERLFNRGWQWAELVRDGEVVGAVLDNEGKRTWWAES